MKSILTIIIMILFSNLSWSQTYTTIYTPTNVSIEAIILPEFSPIDLATVEAIAADWIDDHNSDAVRVAPASAIYNCHGFAWHHSDGGGALWVNQLTQSSQPNISKYWSGSTSTYSVHYSAESQQDFLSERGSFSHCDQFDAVRIQMG